MRYLLCVFTLLGLLFVTPSLTMAQNQESLFRGFQASGLSQADKRFLQTALAFKGHYLGLLDSDWGKLSENALNEYARREFGTTAEEWHMAALAFDFFEVYDRDGWEMRHLDVLNMSMLFPSKAIAIDPPSRDFVNWHSTNSSLRYSVGVLTRDAAQQMHDFTAGSHNSADELYSLFRSNIAITRATQSDGSVLYTRSNLINGAWSTIVLFADRRDVPILTAVAASIEVGIAQPISITKNGKLDDVIQQTLAFAENNSPDSQNPQETSSEQNEAEAQQSSGTGFVVSKAGDVLTNAHVVEGCAVLKFDGNPATVVAESSELDLALLRVEAWNGEGVAMFSPSPARLNSDVTVVGYPLAGILTGLNVTRGAVSSQLGYGGDVKGMQITAPVQPGNSGGPVLAADGEVIGVVVSKLNAQVIADHTGDIPQNVNFAIRSEIAKLFLFQNGVEPVLGTSDEVISPVDIADLARSFTGFIECN